MKDQPSHSYHAEGLERGISDTTVRSSVVSIERAREHGVHPVLSLNHLSHLTGATHKYLRQVVSRRTDPYTEISRPKTDGKVRLISAPDPILMDVQRWILHNSLIGLDNHYRSYAYQAERSIVDCATAHVGSRWLVKLDLHGFFDSIRERRVFAAYRSLGYSALVSFELARISTRLGAWRPPGPGLTDRYRSIDLYTVGGVGALPQGAPTSGALANFIARGLDLALNKIGIERGLVYTRYSDDLTFSAGEGFSRTQATTLISVAEDEIRKAGFQMHYRKTKVIPPGSRRVVLGLLVDEERVRLLPEFRRRVGNHVRSVEKFGLSSHASSRGFHSALAFINHVDGCIAFAIGVDRSWGKEMQARWTQVLYAAGYPLPDGV